MDGWTCNVLVGTPELNSIVMYVHLLNHAHEVFCFFSKHQRQLDQRLGPPSAWLRVWPLVQLFARTIFIAKKMLILENNGKDWRKLDHWLGLLFYFILVLILDSSFSTPRYKFHMFHCVRRLDLLKPLTRLGWLQDYLDL